jgi:hypothetical protein
MYKRKAEDAEPGMLLNASIIISGDGAAICTVVVA